MNSRNWAEKATKKDIDFSLRVGDFVSGRKFLVLKDDYDGLLYSGQIITIMHPYGEAPTSSINVAIFTETGDLVRHGYSICIGDLLSCEFNTKDWQLSFEIVPIDRIPEEALFAVKMTGNVSEAVGERTVF